MHCLLTRASLCVTLASACLAEKNATVVPEGEEGLPYSWTLDECGVTSLASEMCDATLLDAALPPGLQMDFTSRLTGVPTVKGTYNFTVRFRKYPNEIVDRPYKLEIKQTDGPPAAISVNRKTLHFGISPDGSVGTTPQAVTVSTQGTAPVGWSAISNN